MSNPRDTTPNTETRSSTVAPHDLNTNQNPDMETSFSQPSRNMSPDRDLPGSHNLDRSLSNPDTEIDFPNLNRHRYDRGDHDRVNYPYRPRRSPTYNYEYSNDVQLKVHPPKYDGKEDIYEYLDSFEISCQINGWSPYLKGLHLANSLIGSARGILTELQRHEKTDINTLINKLKERYGSQNQNVIFRTELQNRTRRVGESIPELAQNIKKLTLMAYPNTTKEFTDTLARDHFIEAIDDQTLRMKLREAEPITLSEATQIATRFEAYKTAEVRRKQSINVSAGRTESNHFKNNSEHITKPNNSNCTFNNDDAKSGNETVTQLTKTLEKLADAFEKLSKDKHETNQRNTNYRDRSSTPFPGTYGRPSPQNHQQQRNFPQEDTFERPRQWQRFNENNRTQTQNRPHLNQGNENRSSWRPTRRPENPMIRANRFQ